jgi:hypothetical protein
MQAIERRSVMNMEARKLKILGLNPDMNDELFLRANSLRNCLWSTAHWRSVVQIRTTLNVP